MSLAEAIDIILSELPIPDGQAWVTLEELKEKARELDDNKNGLND